MRSFRECKKQYKHRAAMTTTKWVGMVTLDSRAGRASLGLEGGALEAKHVTMYVRVNQLFQESQRLTPLTMAGIA